MRKNVLLLLPVAAVMMLASCGSKEVTRDEFSNAVTERQSSAQTTSYKQVVFQGEFSSESTSGGSQSSNKTTISASTFNVTWNGTTPSFTAQGQVDATANLMFMGMQSQLVLKSSVITTMDPNTTKFYAGGDFRAETNEEETASDGTKTTSTGTVIWNGDLLLTSMKGGSSGGTFGNIDVNFTFNWSK